MFSYTELVWVIKIKKANDIFENKNSACINTKVMLLDHLPLQLYPLCLINEMF